MRRWLFRIAVAGSLLGALAFGAVYPWAFSPLLLTCAVVGATALIIERRGRPPLAVFSAGLLAIAMQPVPARIVMDNLLQSFFDLWILAGGDEQIVF